MESPTRLMWELFVSNKGNVTREQADKLLSDRGLRHSTAPFYVIRKSVALMNEAVRMGLTTAAKIEKYVADHGGTTFSEEMVKVIMNNKVADVVADTKVEAARKFYREKGIASSYNEARAHLSNLGYKDISHKLLWKAATDVRKEIEKNGATQAEALKPTFEAIKRIPSKPVAKVDLSTFREFLALSKKIGLDRMMEVVKFVKKTGVNKVEYMKNVLDEMR